MTKSSKKTQKQKPKKKNLSRSHEKELLKNETDDMVSITNLSFSQDDLNTEALKKTEKHPLRIVDVNSYCEFPETYTVSEDGDMASIYCGDYEQSAKFIVKEKGSGVVYGWTDKDEKFIDYVELSYLVKASQLMNIVQNNEILGDHWHVDNHGRVGKFINILQKLYEEYTTKEG